MQILIRDIAVHKTDRLFRFFISYEKLFVIMTINPPEYVFNEFFYVASFLSRPNAFPDSTLNALSFFIVEIEIEPSKEKN